MPVIGRHMPLDANVRQALQTAQGLGCEAIQIFVSNPRGWQPPAEKPVEVATFAADLRASSLAPIVIHAPYIINLASITDETRHRSQRLLRWTLERGAALGAASVVMHIGSHGGAGLDVGMARLVEGLQAVLTDLPPGPQLLLENDVGAGNTIGSHFDAMATVLTQMGDPLGARLGVCLDTAHLWGAGHDIGTAVAAADTLAAIDQAFGLRRVAVIHLNDTVTALGGHRDLHARLGEGIIGTEGLQTFLRDARLHHAAILLETPIKELPDKQGHDWDDDRRQILYARQLALGEEAPVV